jgi:RNA polymerase sigma-70 factor (ECF subfamily)
MNHRDAQGRSDRILAKAIQDNGDENAFRELYRRHTPRLYLLVLRFLGGVESDAEDVVQETWLRVCEQLDRFRWDSAFSTWLRAIGVNVARDVLRRYGRDPARTGNPVEDPPARPLPLDERMDLERAIILLPDGYRQVLVLHDIEGMKHREIAEALGMSAGASKKQLFNARRIMRDYLAPQEGTGHEG